MSLPDPSAPEAAKPDKHARLPVGVIVERYRTSNPWQEFGWRPAAVVIGAPQSEPWSAVRATGDTAQFFAGTFEIELNARETINYRENLASAMPSVYVVLRIEDGAGPHGLRVHLVTVSPPEAIAYLADGADIVERVPMPEMIALWLDEYIAAYHVEEPFYKRQRQKHDPNKVGFGSGGPGTPGAGRRS
ncbi:MAG: DUF3305 domain-containing protein [Rhodospirillales bacterium]|nr:DUF3305 domain-containing protein [Rhodospirillales bacterium]